MERERKEPTFSQPDRSDVKFGTAGNVRRHPASPKPDNSLVWKIAAGVFIGTMLCVLATCSLFGLGAAAVVHEQEKAQKAAVEEFVRMANDPDPFGIQKQFAEQQHRVEARQRAEREARALKPGQRCIGGKRYERIEGGWRDLPHEPC